MGRKKERLKPDIIVKNYWRNNEQFADFFNAALFGGKQIIRDDNAVKCKKEKGLSENEYLSKMRKTDRFTPIITIVVYYGEVAWDGAFSLHGMLNIPEVMKQFVNDYKMHLVEARKNNLFFHNINNKDLFNLLEILLDNSRKLNETKEKAIEYAREHKVDKSVIMTVAGATNRKLDYNSIEMKGDADMCTVFEETWKDGEAKGIIETGYDFGISNDDILIQLQKKLNITLQKAQEYLSTYGQK